MDKSKKYCRHTGIELLRSLAMLMVLSLHFFIKGQYSKSNDLTINFESWIMICFSVVAGNCFVLISGYFLTEKSFRLYRITQTYSQVFFYSVITFVLVVLFGIQPFSVGKAFTAITPIIHNCYWFATTYLLLLLFTPLLNTAINNMSKCKFQLLLFVLLGLYCVFNNIVKLINPIDNTAGYGVLWFIILYLSSAYLKKYYAPNNKPIKYFILYCGTVIINLTFHTLFGHLGEVWNNGMVRDYNNILVYLGAVFLFLTFLNIKINNKFVNRIILFFAPLTFAVYLLHESPFISEWLWEMINVDTWCINNVAFIFMALGTILCLFLIFSLFEYFRKTLFKLFKIDIIIIRISNYIEEKIRGFVISRGIK